MGREMAAKEEIKQITRDGAAEHVKNYGKPETTDGVKAEATEAVSGSAGGSDERSIQVAPTEQPSSGPPAIPFQPETFLPAPIQLRLATGWNAPSDWGLDEWVEQVDIVGYWQDQFGRVDALLTKRRGEALWHCWNWFRQRRIQIKKEGKKLKDEPVTWRRLMAKKKWDPASTSRRIKFYLDHKDTPDDQLSGETIVNMWNGRRDHEEDPPALGSCWQCSQTHLLVFCDEQGQMTSNQGLVKEGTILEIIDFKDWNRSQDALVRIRTGIHTGKHLRMLGAELSHLPSIPLEKVPFLQQEIEDAPTQEDQAEGQEQGWASSR